MVIHYPYCKTGFGSLEWQCKFRQVISSCERCIQHKGAWVKAPLQGILVTSPLELLHVDFIGIETTMELDQTLTCIVNVLVFCDQFMRHMSWHMRLLFRWQKAIAKFLWQGYILIFRALAKAPEWLRSPPLRATSSASCVNSWAFGRQELALYHLQTNG